MGHIKIINENCWTLILERIFLKVFLGEIIPQSRDIPLNIFKV